jgi:hypothetical protein
MTNEEMTTREELKVAVDGFVTAILQKSTEILRANWRDLPSGDVTKDGVQTFEDVVRMLATSTIEANKQKWIGDVPTPTSRAWPF